MRAKVLIAVCALALGALGGWFARTPARAERIEPAPLAPLVPLAPMPRPAEEIVPLRDRYHLVPARAVNDLPPPASKSWDELESKLLAHFRCCGITTAFLVPVANRSSVRDVHAAMYDTWKVLGHGRSSDRVDLRPEVDREYRPWLFVLLSDPEPETVTDIARIAVRDGRIEVQTRQVPFDETMRFSRTFRYHACWARLPPEVAREWMEIVVIDERSPVPLLSRRVEVRR